MNRLASICLLLSTSLATGQTSTLHQIQMIPLNVQGRIDHFSFDLKTHRLFVCALGNNTCEVVDADAGKVIDSIKGMSDPQGVRHLPKPNRLVIANAVDGSVRIYDAASLQSLHQIDLKNDADNVRHDSNPGFGWRKINKIS